jgi:hypothetical protein
MSRNNRRPLAERVIEAAEASLAAQKYASPFGVLLGLGWLDPNTARRWQQGQIDCLEEVMQTNPARLSEAMTLLQSWAAGKGLPASEARYVARTPQHQTLRFSRSGDPALERLFRTHWVSGELSEKQQDRLREKASRPPELVVIQPLNDAWTCHRCGGTGALLIMEPPGPACLRCAGLDDLEFLGAGDALLTRRAKAKSARHAVVVRFSRTRRRYERQGVLIEPQVLEDVRRQLETEPGRQTAVPAPNHVRGRSRSGHGSSNP